MILRMVKEGKLSVEEADALLQTLEGERAAEDVTDLPEAPEVPGAPERPQGPKIQIELGKIIEDIAETIPREVLRRMKLGVRGRPRSRFSEIVAGLAGMAEEQTETRGEVPMTAGDTLEVRNRWGDVTLHRSPDQQMRFSAWIRAWGAASEDAEAILSHVAIQAQRRGNTVLLEVPRVEGRRLRVDFDIAVPEGGRMLIEEAKGDLRAHGLHGELNVQLASGDVQLQDHTGAVDLDVKSGDLTLERVEGNVIMDLKSGDVEIGEIRGNLRGLVVSGDVRVAAAEAVSLDVISGDVEVSGAEGGVSVDTKSGDIDVRLPLEARASIEATVMSGEIDCSLPLQERVTDRRLLRGLLNGGGTPVRLRALSGDITIRGNR